MTDFCTIPIIDISIFANDKVPPSFEDTRDLCYAWDQAMQKYGACAIIGHSISSSIFKDLLQEGDKFFNSPMEEKLSYNHGRYGHPLGGYTSPNGENVALSLSIGEVEAAAKIANNDDESLESQNPGEETLKDVSYHNQVKADPLESFVFTSPPEFFRSPNGHASPMHSASAYYQQMSRVLKALHVISSRALGLDGDDYIHNFYTHPDLYRGDLPVESKADISFGALRLTHYFVDVHSLPVSSLSEVDGAASEPSLLYGAHTDYMGFTILKPDENDWQSFVDSSGNVVELGGLEVFVRDDSSCSSGGSGQWMPVRLPAGRQALVINAGDVIQRWTNDRWHSPLHRVVGNRRHISRSLPHSSSSSSSSSTTSDGFFSKAADDVSTALTKSEKISKDFSSRWTLVFFSGPLADNIVQVLDCPAVMSQPDRPAKYEPIRSGDYLMIKLNKTN